MEELERRPEGLYAPMRYMMKLPAKRVRPLLCILAYHSFHPLEHYPKSLYDLAISIELFHNFTLIHDDIMDHAKLRRGVPTVHEQYDVNTAILAGDALFAMVFQQMAKAYPNHAGEMIGFFAPIAIEVCEGQAMDLQMSKQEKVTLDEYLIMIRKKTAVLIGASLALGAMAANAPKLTVNKFYQLGEYVGMAFQLQDDYLDVFAEQSFGKQIGGDILENKKTFLLISALHEAMGSELDDLMYWLNYPHKAQEKVFAVKAIFERLGVKDKCLQATANFFHHGHQILEELQQQGLQVEPIHNFFQSLQQRQT